MGNEFQGEKIERLRRGEREEEKGDPTPCAGSSLPGFCRSSQKTDISRLWERGEKGEGANT